MENWRQRLLDEARRAGLLSQAEAAEIERRELGDTDFVAAVFGSINTSDAGIAALEALAGPELLSTQSDSGSSDAHDVTGSSDALLLPGLPPEYSLKCLHREGGMALVYQASQEHPKRQVAIKVPKVSVVDDTRAELLRREQDVIAALKHPDIVTVLTAGRLADGRPYYVMPFVEGLVLTEWANEHKPDIREVVALVERVARAMGTAHLVHVVHRDLTPRNIMVTPDGDPKILDFGLAAVPGSDCLDGHVIGTRGYMSPEQRSGKTVGPESDVYSLGVILWQLLTADPDHSRFRPLPSQTTLSTADGGVTRPLPPMPQVRKDLQAIVAKCLGEDPSARYPTAVELADDLQRWLANYPVHAYTGFRPLYHIEKFARRQPLFTSAAVLLAVVMVGGFLGIDQQRRIASTAALEEFAARSEAERQGQVAATQRDRAETELLRDGVQSANRLLRDGRIDEVQEAIIRVPPSRRSWECLRMKHEADIAPGVQRVFDGHDWGILASLALPDGRLLVTAGNDGRLLMVDSASEGQVTELAAGRWSEERRMYLPAWPTYVANSNGQPAADCYVDLAWLGSGREFIAANHNGRVVLWTLPDPTPRTLFQGDKALTSVAVASDGLAILLGDVDGRLTLVNREGKIQATRTVSGGCITDIVALPEAWCVAQVGGTVRTFDRILGEELGSFSDAGPVFDLDFDQTTRQMAIAANGSALGVVQFDKGYREIVGRQTIPLPPDANAVPSAVHAVRWSANGRHLFGGDDRGRLICWDTATWTVRFVRNDQGPGWRRPSESRRPAIPARAISAIHVADEPKLAYTTGRDGTIKEWNLAARDGIRRFQAGQNPKIAFADDGQMLWSLTADGRLSLWDTTTVKCCSAVHAIEGTTEGSFSASRDGRLVCTAAGRTVRFWRSHGRDIQNGPAEITAPADVLALAIDPAASHVAAYLRDDSITSWSLADQGIVARRSLRSAGVGAAHGALIAYSADGRKLAAAGPHAPCTILDAARSLAVIDRPGATFAGNGGTAIAWDPTDSAHLLGADTLGRVYLHPERGWEHAADVVFDGRPVAAATFTSDGRRLVAASQDGTIAVIEPQSLGVIWTRQAGQKSPVTDLTFDPRGRTLALAHESGTIELWDAASLELPPVASPRRWREVRLLDGDRAIDLSYRDASVALDADGRPLIVLSRRLRASSAHEPAPYEVILAILQAGRLTEIRLETTGLLEHRPQDGLRRSLACALFNDKIIAALRRPRPDIVNGAGQLVVHEFSMPLSQAATAARPAGNGPVTSNNVGEPLTPPENSGFDTWLVPDPKASFAALHFSHHGHYLLASRRVGDAWQTSKVGRQGDGLHMVVGRGTAGPLFACFSPTRYNGDPLPAVCLTLDPSDFAITCRETPSSSDGTGIVSVAVDDRSHPILLHKGRGPDATQQLALWRRQADDKWTQEVIASDPFNRLGPSNLLCDAAGQVHLAVLDGYANRLYWLTQRPTGWTSELVHEFSTSDLDETATCIGPVARLSPSGRPFILLGHPSVTDGWLRFFEPAD